MALYIITNGKQEKAFHVPFTKFEENIINSATMIQADGDELDHIQYRFTTTDAKQYKTGYSIPMPLGGRVVKWYGDIAKTILANL